MTIAIYKQTIEFLDWPFGPTLATIPLVTVLGLSRAYGAQADGREKAEAWT